MRRFGRKLDVDRMRAELPLQPFWFDALYLDSGELLDSRRIAVLPSSRESAVRGR